VLTVQIDFSKAQYAKERRLAVYRDLSDRLAAIPGVVSAAQVGFTPVGGSGLDNSVGPDTHRRRRAGRRGGSIETGPGYFRTMGTRLVAGREFTERRDTVSSPKVAIVNEMFRAQNSSAGRIRGQHIPSGSGGRQAGNAVPRSWAW